MKKNSFWVNLVLMSIPAVVLTLVFNLSSESSDIDQGSSHHQEEYYSVSDDLRDAVHDQTSMRGPFCYYDGS